jgi:integrase
MPKLTIRTVNAIKMKPGDDTFVWDDELRGFGVRAKSPGTGKGGSKSFIVQYRNKSGRSRRVTIGRLGVITPEQARIKAKHLLAAVLNGEDPAEVHALDRSAITVAELCHEYLDRSEQGLIMTRRKEAKKASTLYTDRGRIDRHIVPLLGRRRVLDLSSADVRGFVRDVIAGKTKLDIKTKLRGRSIVTGGKGTATRTTALFSSILTYAVGEGYRTDNPARGVVLPSYKKRRERLTVDQYAVLGRALREAEQKGEPWQAVGAIRLLALTGSRRGEVTDLLKSEIDIDGQLLQLTDTKTGPSVRPIGLRAVDLITASSSRAESHYLFPAVRSAGAAYGGLPNAWARIVKPLLPGVTPHTLRHAFASVADDLGYTEATIAAMLGHSGGGTTRGYIHKLDPALVAAADRVADAVSRMIGGF